MGDNEHRLSMIKTQKGLKIKLMHVIQCVGGQSVGNHLCNSSLHQHLEWRHRIKARNLKCLWPRCLSGDECAVADYVRPAKIISLKYTSPRTKSSVGATSQNHASSCLIQDLTFSRFTVPVIRTMHNSIHNSI